MARSLKKGPFADESLLKKVDAMNEAGEKTVIKTWSRPLHHLPADGWSLQSQFTTEEDTFRYTSQRIW